MTIGSPPAASSRSRWKRAGAALLVTGALIAGCTSTSSGGATTSPSLSVGGSAVGSSSGPSSAASTAVASPSSGPTAAPVSPTASETSSASTSKTRSSAAPPTKSRSATPTTSRSLPPPTVETAGLSPQEITDRTDIENAWVKYWNVTSDIFNTPKARRGPLLESVAVKAQARSVLLQAQSYEK